MAMKRALILDTETTGLDPAKDRVVEVACILYDLEHAAPVESFATLVMGESNEAEAVNRIPSALLRYGRSDTTAWKIVRTYTERADVFLAHRAEFDRGFCPADVANALPWACTKFHFEWPLAKAGEHLVHLALAHGVGVVHAHRAMTDCDILSRLLTRVHEMGHSLPAMVDRALRPRVKVVSMAPFEEKDVVKGHGFAWDPTARHWWREMVAEDIGALPFKTRAA